MPQGSGEAGASQGDSGNEGTASSSWTRQRRPSVAASSVAENWSPDYAGSGGRRESSFKQDRRDSQVLGEFRDIYARRESQMSQGSGVGSMGLGSLPLSSASVRSKGGTGSEGTASGSWTRQRRPSVAASSVAENWSPDYAGSGGRRESSFKQDRRDSQVLGEFRDIYARRESQMSQGSGVGSMGLGSLPLSSASAAYLAVPGPRKSQRSPSGVFSASGSEFSFTSSASPKRMAGEFERLIPKGTPSKDSPSPYTSPFTSQQSSPRRSAATSSDKDRSAASSTSRRGSRRKSTLKRAGSNLLKDDK
ncbi:unnamed protein product [Durusdinium trenchii]|uniref:Uncharacterized protein n=1 Tax=Durusdinium trenchii TaxID=1381693 RepID=A0ABP0SUJ4_9DINO